MAGKVAESEPVGMGKADLKRMLKLARRGPVRAAFAVGADGRPIVVMDRRKQARALEKGIKQAAPEAKGHRFGSVAVDPDDPRLALFVVNKAASGMARKLVLALKGTGFNKVRVALDDGTELDAAEGEPEEESFDDADEDEAEDETGDGTEDDAEAADGGEADVAPGDAAPGDAEPDAAGLAASLTDLVKRMVRAIAEDPSRKEALVELATDAQAGLKRGDFEGAAAGIEVLRRAMEAGPGDAPVGGVAEDAQPEGDAVPVDTPPEAPPEAEWETPPSFDPADDTSAQGRGGETEGDGEGARGAGDEPGGGGAASAQDIAALTATLTALVKRMVPVVQADPARKDELTALAAAAQACLKAGDVEAAAASADLLLRALDQTPVDAGSGDVPSGGVPVDAPPGQPAPNGVGPTFTKARVAWLATRQRVESEVGKLQGAMAAVYQGHAVSGDLEKIFRSKVDPVLDTLDESLAHKLDEVVQNTDPARHDKLVQDAKRIIEGYQAYLAREPLIAMLDNNPFLPLAVEKTLTATLTALSKAIK